MALNTAEIDKITDYLDRASKLADEDTVAFFEKNKTAIKNAKNAMADNEEKYAYLLDAVTRWANQLTFMLFRDDKLSDELLKEFRTFTPVSDTTAKVKEFQDERQARIDKVNAEHQDILQEQKGVDIFQAVISGMTVDEAKAKMEEYNQKMAAAQRGA